jgi:excisionase family DNA binding protein
MNLSSTSTSLPEKLLKASDVAKILNVSRAFAYQLMARGEITTVQLGHARRVRPQDLEDFITGNLYSSRPKIG